MRIFIIRVGVGDEVLFCWWSGGCGKVSFDGIQVLSEVLDIDGETTVYHFDQEVFLDISQ